MFHPGVHSENETLIGYIDAQLVALRTAAHGLTEEQARQRPCRSALSIGGLIKHATHVIAGHVPALSPRVEGKPSREQWAAMAAKFQDSFALREDESLEGALREFDLTRKALMEHLETLDPGHDVMAPPAPWYGRDESVPAKARWELTHLIEELARHAGHADILREEIDGAQAGPLYLAVAGLRGNQFMQAWRPPQDG